MKYQRTIKIDPEFAKQLQPLIDDNKPFPDKGHTEIIETFTAKFQHGFEVDIKVCNGDNGPWIDAVLFQDGSECMCIDHEYKLLGHYHFCYTGETTIHFHVFLK